MRVADYSNHIFEDDDVEHEFKAILSDVEKDKKIEDLSLMGNGLKSTQLESLAATLSSHLNLTALNLSANTGILEGGMSSLKKIIMEHQNLKFIQLDFNNITDTDIESLLENNTKELNEKILSINFCFSSNLLTEKSLKIADGKLSSSTILSMLSGNYLTKDEATVNTFRNQEISKLENEKTQSKDETKPISKTLLLSSNAPSSIPRTPDKTEPKKRKSDEIKNFIINNLSDLNDKEFDEFIEDLREKRKLHKASQQQLLS